MNSIESIDRINVPLNSSQNEADITAALQQFQELGLLDTVDALKPFAYEGYSDWQTSEWFVNTDNWMPVMEKVIAAMSLVSRYPHFLDDPYRLELDTCESRSDYEKGFPVCKYPEVMSHIKGDIKISKWILGIDVAQMREMLQKYLSLATAKPYKRKLAGIKSELIYSFGLAKSTDENKILGDPLRYDINPIEYTNIMIKKRRGQGYMSALVRMIDVLYGSGRGDLPKQTDSTDQVVYNM